MAFKNPNIAPTKKRKGRPPGSKTRPDAPSKLKKNGNLLPANAPAPVTQIESIPDTQLFGDIKPAIDSPVDAGKDSVIPDETISPLSSDASQPAPGAPEPEPAASEAPPEPKPDDAEAQRPLVSLVIDSTIGTLATVIGPFWYPRPVGTDIGMVPYDERERLVKSGCRWFASMAIEALTPAQEFAMECFNYSLPRMKQTYDWFKIRFMKKAKPASSAGNEKDPRVAKTENIPTPNGETINVETVKT